MIAQWAWLFVAAALGGTLNSVAGGGSFFTFPALLLAGVPAVPANATSTVALWPGSVASVGAYRREVARAPHLRLLGTVSLAGGVAGALLLLHTPSAAFARMVPYLLMLATALFAFGGPMTRLARRLRRPGGGGAPAAPAAHGVLALALVQFVIAVYGGFFGGGIGILMLAALRVAGLEDIHVMNGIKTLQAALINGAAVVAFIVAGKVFWPEALLMVIGAVAGGYAGAAGARRVPQQLIRAAVIGVGGVMSAYFLFRGTR